MTKMEKRRLRALVKKLIRQSQKAIRKTHKRDKSETTPERYSFNRSVLLGDAHGLGHAALQLSELIKELDKKKRRKT